MWVWQLFCAKGLSEHGVSMLHCMYLDECSNLYIRC
jgi:hypothetical protein